MMVLHVMSCHVCVSICVSVHRSLIPACACNAPRSFKDDLRFVVSIFRFRSAYLKEAALFFLGSDLNMKTQQSESRCAPVN